MRALAFELGRQRSIAERDCENLRFQSLPVARIARLGAHEGFEPVLRKLALAFLIEPVEVRDDTLERAFDFTHLAGAPEMKFNSLRARTVEQHALERIRQRFVRRFEAVPVVLCHCAQHAFVISDHSLAAAPPRQNRPLVERFFRVGHDQSCVENHLLAEAVADRTGAERRVERKMFWSEPIKALARGRAVKPIGIQGLVPGLRHKAWRLMQQKQPAFSPFERGFHGIAQPNADLVVDHQPIHHHFDDMLSFRIELHPDVGGQFQQASIHASADKPFAGEPLNHVAKFPLLVRHYRREQHHPRFRWQRQDLIHDVAGGLVCDRFAADRAMRLSYVGEQQTEIIVNLGGRRDGGTRVRARTALFNRDGWRKALDVVHVRLLHLVEELARVGGEGFDVLPLAFGEDRVEGQRRFARTAQTGEHHQLVAGNVQREVFEIMLTRAADPDEFLCHNGQISQSKQSPTLTGRWKMKSQVLTRAPKAKGQKPEGQGASRSR